MPIRRHQPTAAAKPRRSGPDRRRRGALVLVAVLALAGVAAFIGQGSVSSSTENSATENSAADGVATSAEARLAGEAPATSLAPSAAPEVDGDSSSADGAASGYAGAAAPDEVATATGTEIGAPVGPKVVRTGSIEVEVGRGRFAEATNQLQAIATGAGGFVSASETSSLDGDPRGSLTLRVPAASFDGVLGRVAKLGTVRSSTTGSQDVTGEYSDVAARLRALQDEREQIGLVLGKAETITDILSVRDRLSVVQGELEQLQGRKQVLDDQTSLSTITVALSEKGASPISLDRPADRRGLAKVWHDSIDRIADGGRAITLGFAAMLPWLLLGLVLWLPARMLWRRLVPGASQATVSSSPPPVATTAD